MCKGGQIIYFSETINLPVCSKRICFLEGLIITFLPNKTDNLTTLLYRLLNSYKTQTFTIKLFLQKDVNPCNELPVQSSYSDIKKIRKQKTEGSINFGYRHFKQVLIG